MCGTPGPRRTPAGTALTLAGSGYSSVNLGHPRAVAHRGTYGGGWGRPLVTVSPPGFRDALSRFASGVCVLTTADAAGRPVGITISAFSSLSLQPPLVLFCIGNRSVNLAAWLEAGQFSVNVLAEGQAALSESFASAREDKFAGVPGSIGSNGCFRLEGALVTLECRRVAVHQTGDHYIIIGHVDHVVPGPDDPPLLRFRGRYRTLAEER